MNQPVRLAYLVSHPIQYQAPLLREIASDPFFDLRVYFMSDFSLREYRDPGFRAAVEWDVPLTEGYKSQLLRPHNHDVKMDFLHPNCRGLGGFIDPARTDVLWVHGYHQITLIRAILRAKRVGVKVLVRSENNRDVVARGRGVRGHLKEACVRWLLAKADGFLAIGSRNAEYYGSLGVSADKIHFMPYAVDNDRFVKSCTEAADSRSAFRADLGLDANRPVILFAGKFQKRKCAIELLEAYLAAYDQFGSRKPYLIFVGDGEERKAVEARAKATRPPDILFIGFVNQSELPRYYDLCDVFVLPSRREPWGLAINEVMCAGKAIIASSEVGCVPDLVRDGENGYVVEPGDVPALRDALLTTFRIEGNAANLGRRSKEIIENFSFETDIIALKAAICSFS